MSGTPVVANAWAPRTVGIALAAYQPNPVWLAEQLASIVAQTHTEWTCVITLDSSLKEIASRSELTEFFHDRRFTWVENAERLGVRLNFQKAIALVLRHNPDLIAFCDQDDIWMPEKLARGIQAITGFGSLSMVFNDSYIFSGEEVLSETLHSTHRIVQTSLTVPEIIIYPSVSGFTMIFDAEIARKHPTIPEPMRYHDHWYSVVATAYRGVIRIDEPLSFYRQHDGNAVGLSAIRASLGLKKVSANLGELTTMQYRSWCYQGSSLAAVRELPLSRITRALLTSRPGWIILMLAIVLRRAATESRLVRRAFRAIIVALAVFPSQAQRATGLRNRIPVLQFKRVIGVLSVAVVAAMFALWPEVANDLVRTASPVLWVGIAGAALFMPSLRFLRHVFPSALPIIIGLSALIAAAVRIASGDALSSAIVFALPLVPYAAYRLRWRGDTGY
jgi:hypothetical protein